MTNLVQLHAVASMRNLEERIEGLTDAEKSYMETNLVELDAGDVDRLHRLALFLLAGLPLKKFVGPLVSSAFSASLTPTIGSPHSEFEQLLRWNFVDWAETREALLEWIGCIGDERSSVGNWTVAVALRGTGDQSDAAEAQRLTEMLTTNYKKVGPWRLVETYCATDPCDPEAPRPENISGTAEKYRNTAVDRVALTMGNSEETYFLRKALPGVARFKPEAGAYAIRKLAVNALARQGVPRRQAVLTLLPHSVLLARQDVDALVSHAQSVRGSSRNQSGTSDDWLTAQYSLFIALPHLSGNEQLTALNGMQTDSLLVNLLGTIRPAEAAVVESLFEAAFADKDAQRLLRLMAAVCHAKAPLTARAKGIIAELLEFPENTVRAEALAIASTYKSKLLLKRLANSNWDAARLTPNKDHFELWYGSAAFVAAVRVGVINVDEALDRMALSHYGIAAELLGDRAARLVADRVEVALGKVLNLGEFTGLPEMEQAVPDSGSSLPPLVSLGEASSTVDSLAAFKRLAETEKQFDERQRRLHRAYERFSRELTKSDAHLVLTNFTTEGMSAVVTARPDVIRGWHALLIRAEDIKKPSIHNFAIEFAGAISAEHTELAVSLFRAYSRVEPLVRQVIGMAKVPMEAEVLWSRGNNPEISVLCTERLDNCTSDDEIAVEVLAAFANKQENILRSYVERLLSTREPVHIGRALTVAGFSDESAFAEDALSRFNGAKGFVGEAHLAARGAYDRNRWSKHWYECIRSATSEVDFWRYSVLLSKIVDGRVDLWGDFERSKESFKAFIPTIRDRIKNRIDRWNGKRKKTLFGGKIPHAVFLIRDNRLH